MPMLVRTVTTPSGNTGVQVVERSGQRTRVIKHIGSAKNTAELDSLITLAHQYIREKNTTIPLFPDLFKDAEQKHFLSVDQLVFTHTYHLFAYEFFSFFYERTGFAPLANPVLKDLAIIRLIEPASKIASLDLLREYFAITYGHTTLYNSLKQIRQQKESIEQAAITYAKKYLSFDFSLVFYDVTTLYFETFKEDGDEKVTKKEKGTENTVNETETQKEQTTSATTIQGLRKPGFSKDGKPLQPQIVIGLVVNRDGYPISIEMFSGNTFEGHTMIPVIKRLQDKHGIQTLTIVADAGMLSQDNIDAIKEAELSYIVGARLGNIAKKTLTTIATELNKREGIISTTETNHGTLICEYSEKRATKDKSDRKKQIARATAQIKNPDKVKRRARFVTEETKATLKLNQELIKSDELKEGIKGYYTNLILNDKLTANDIISRYKDLWHVEKSFRIAKSDLEARPIFHHKRDSIEAHILIVFVSLCMAKAIELLSKRSIRQVKKLVWPVLDIGFTDSLTNKTFMKRMDTARNPMAALWEKLRDEY